jgi:hypothetical protein
MAEQQQQQQQRQQELPTPANAKALLIISVPEILPDESDEFMAEVIVKLTDLDDIWCSGLLCLPDAARKQAVRLLGLAPAGKHCAPALCGHLQAVAGLTLSCNRCRFRHHKSTLTCRPCNFAQPPLSATGRNTLHSSCCMQV